MKQPDDNKARRRQILGGAAILFGLAAVACGLLLGWRHVPGLLGEWLGTMVGVMTTPFILEASCLFIGLTVVLAINHWRQKRAGDEWVYLEQVDPPAAQENALPDQATWAVYPNPPLEGEVPSLQTRAEGALGIEDYDTVKECLAAMDEDELKRPETLALRLALARATGHDHLVGLLERELRMALDGSAAGSQAVS